MSVLVGMASTALAWVPTGATNLMARPQCRAEVLAKKIVERFGSRTEVSFDTRVWTGVETLIQEFFDECSEDLRRSSLSNLIDYTEMSLVSYDLKNHPQVHEVEFLIPEDGFVVKGLLALKKSKEPLPLVIFKCGLGCNLMDPSMLYTMMVFFDMGPFNVLAIPSNSGSDFVNENRTYAVGGLEEGRQLVQISRYIESGSWKYSKYVSRIHLFGMSLGGHASLYGSLYSDYLRPSGEPLFSSVFVGCPVVDFKKSLQDVTSESIVAKLMRRTVLKNITSMLLVVPFFDKYFIGRDTSYSPSQSELREMLVSGAFDYYKRKTDALSWTMPPFEELRFSNEDTLWNWMNFSNEPVKKMRTPVYVWAPKNDDVVLFDSNAKKLFEADAQMPERRVFKLNTDLGGHCAFPSIFGWSVSSVVMNALFIARSPELVRKMKLETLEIPEGKFGWKNVASLRKWRTDLSWIAVENDKFVTLRSSFREVPCRQTSRSPQRCISVNRTRFTYKEIGLDDSDIPKSAVEAHGFSRWLNARLRFIDSRGAPLDKTGKPAAMRWIRFGNSRI